MKILAAATKEDLDKAMTALKAAFPAGMDAKVAISCIVLGLTYFKAQGCSRQGARELMDQLFTWTESKG